MINQKQNFHYDKLSDSLVVSNRQENETIRESFEVGDMIVSLTGKGKIVAIEIREVSSFLESCNVKSDVLDKLKNVELRIVPKKNMILLILKIEFEEKEFFLSKEIPFVMPLIDQ